MFVRAKIDFVNKKFSAWLVPRKTESGSYTATEPGDGDLLVENADMLNTSAVQFGGISYYINNYNYGNEVSISNVKVSEYTPEEIVATPTPEPTAESTPAPTAGHEEGVALKFAVLSDMQYGRTSQESGLSNYEYAGKKFKKALNSVIEQAGGIEQLDAIMIPGDISHNSNTAEYQAFVSDLESVIPKGSHTKVLFLRGNHDAKPDKQGNFVTELSKYDETLTSANNVYDIYGYKFIMVSQDTQRLNDEASDYPYLHSPDTVSWFTDTVKTAAEEAASEGKPIFVGMHPNVKDTVYGSFVVEGMRNGKAYNSNYWGTDELKSALTPYSNAITFSGHSHWDIANERSIHQGDFTSLNTGAVNNLEIEDCWDEACQPKRFGNSEKECSGYYIEVGTDNVVTVHRMDFNRDREFKQPWVIDVNDKDNWQYTDTRDQKAPYFPEGASATVSSVGETTCKVTFTQAKDDETDAGHYLVDVINQDTGKSEKKYTVSSYYWQGDQAPAENYWNVSGLQPGTNYKAVITAYDSFYRPSESTIETGVFTTSERVEKFPEITKVSFNANGIIDTSNYAKFYDMQPESFGSVPVEYNTELNMYEGSFARNAEDKNSPNFFKVMLDEGRKALMQGSGGYTIDILYKPTAFNGADNVIGAAQSSGFDIETTSDGTLEAYVRHNGAWVKNSDNTYPGSSTVLATDTYYHITVTYNGSEVKVYKDGTLIDTASASGSMEFYSGDDDNFCMVIGGDYNPTKGENDAMIPQTLAQNAFTGKIVTAGIYGGALEESEVRALNEKYEARKALTKIDGLNDLLTGGSITDEALLAEGWELMADEDTTDEDINAFTAKANGGKTVNYNLRADKTNITADNPVSNYGITADTKKIWSVVKDNSVSTCYVDALRFSTRTANNTYDKNPIPDGEIGHIEFAKDKINNPNGVTFENGKYVYESEFALIYKDGGVFDMTLKGRDAAGSEKSIAAMRFVTTSDTANNVGEIYMLGADGSKIGSGIKYKYATSDDKNAAQVLYARIELDTNTGLCTAYVVPRKTEGGAYTGTEYSKKTMIAENIPFICGEVKSLDSVSFDITKSTSTNIMWVNNISISGENGDALSYIKASVTAGDDIATAGGDVTAAIENHTENDADMTLYVAQYAQDGTLAGVTKAEKQIAAGTSDTIGESVTVKDGCAKIKLMLWDADMKTYASCER